MRPAHRAEGRVGVHRRSAAWAACGRAGRSRLCRRSHQRGAAVHAERRVAVHIAATVRTPRDPWRGGIPRYRRSRILRVGRRVTACGSRLILLIQRGRLGRRHARPTVGAKLMIGLQCKTAGTGCHTSPLFVRLYCAQAAPWLKPSSVLCTDHRAAAHRAKEPLCIQCSTGAPEVQSSGNAGVGARQPPQKRGLSSAWPLLPARQNSDPPARLKPRSIPDTSHTLAQLIGCAGVAQLHQSHHL